MKKEFALVLGVCAVVFLTNLGGPRLWDRDETRNAGCAVEMLAAQDWVTPVFNGELRPHKPALTYWLMMLSYSLLGVSEFSARLPSVLLGMGTCLCTWQIGRRLFGARAGLWAGIVLATSMMFGVASRAATPDAALIFFSCFAITQYVVACTLPVRAGEPSGFVRLFPEHWLPWAGVSASMGAGVLAKGPIGLILPTAVIGMFLLLKRLPRTAADGESVSLRQRLLALFSAFAPRHFLATCWSMRPLTTLAVAGAVALPWYLWVHFRTDGEWTRGFFLDHHFQRATTSMDNHNGGLLFYPLTLLAGFFPWSIFWIPVLLDGLRQRRTACVRANGILFAFCWVGVYVGLFSLARTKLPSYITPCYPALALLTGSWLARWTSNSAELSPLMRRLAFGSLIATGGLFLLGMPILSKLYFPGEALLGLLGIVPVLGGVVAWRLAAGQPLASARIMSTTAAVMAVMIFAFLSDRIGEHRHIEDLVEAVYEGHSQESVELASLTATEASWVFYCRRPIPVLTSVDDAARFLDSPAPGKHHVLITTEDRLWMTRERLQQEHFRITTVPYFLEQDRIVIVESLRPGQEARADDQTLTR